MLLHPDGSEELLSEVENELKVHTQIEEEIFYPAFKDAVESQKDEHLYYEALEEHHVVDLVLPPLLARYRVTGWEIACLGHGGLLA